MTPQPQEKCPRCGTIHTPCGDGAEQCRCPNGIHFPQPNSMEERCFYCKNPENLKAMSEAGSTVCHNCKRVLHPQPNSMEERFSGAKLYDMFHVENQEKNGVGHKTFAGFSKVLVSKIRQEISLAREEGKKEGVKTLLAYQQRVTEDEMKEGRAAFLKAFQKEIEKEATEQERKRCVEIARGRMEHIGTLLALEVNHPARIRKENTNEILTDLIAEIMKP